MIKLLKLPNTTAISILHKDNQLYADAAGIVDPFDLLIRRELTINGYEYYNIFKGNTKIGFVSGFIQGNYWFGHRVYIYEPYRRYFKALITTLDALALSKGLRGTIVHPDRYTANLYSKHNIGKEL